MENTQIKSQEIDLIEILRKIHNNKYFIFKYLLYFLFFGIIIAILTPRKYKAGSIFVPMISSASSSSSGLSGLASLAGINLSGSMESSDIAPNLYPEIVESVPFKQELSLVKIPYQDSEITYRQYFNIKSKSFIGVLKKYTIGLPSLILKNLINNKESIINKDPQLISLSDEDFIFYKQFDQLIEINVDLKEGYIELNVNFDNKIGAALIAKKAVEILQKKVIEYKIKQASEVLKYAEQQKEIKRNLLYETQSKLALFKDKNVFISTSTFQNQLMRLESEYNNANIVFQEVSKQVEEAKLQVSKDTPIFSILKPVVVPNISSTNRILIILIWEFIGLIISILIIFFKEPLFELYKKIN